MEVTKFYKFLPTKAEEIEEQELLGTHKRHYINELVEIRKGPKRIRELYYPWPIKKILTSDDVGHRSRLELWHEQVSNHIFRFWDKGLVRRIVEGKEVGVVVVVRDFDTGCSQHNLVFRKLKLEGNSSTFVIDSNWREEFVIRRNLRKGDEIGLCWKRDFFGFSLLKQSSPGGASYQ